MPPDQLKCAFHQHQAGTSLFPFLFVCREGKGEQTTSFAILNWTVSTCLSAPTWLSCSTVGSHGAGILFHTHLSFSSPRHHSSKHWVLVTSCAHICVSVWRERVFLPWQVNILGGVSYSISSEARSAERAPARQQTSGLRRMNQCY